MMLELAIQKRLAHFTLDLSFTVQNEILVLSGPSGAGKTTVLDSLAGLSKPDSGFIRFNDTFLYDAANICLPPQKRNIGYLFQDYALFPHMSVEKNILYGVKNPESREHEKLVEVLGISHLVNKYPHQISGGEKQRVALARALATKPNLLLLDEPLSALDHDTRIQCQDELIRLQRMWSIPFIIVTHDREEARKLGDRILSIEQGRIKT